MLCNTGQVVNGFEYPYEQSSKIADVLFIFDDPDGINDSCTCAIEVGSSQPYHDLVQTVKLWLEGRRDIQTVVLVKVQELPGYQSPTRNLLDEEVMDMFLPLKV